MTRRMTRTYAFLGKRFKKYFCGYGSWVGVLISYSSRRNQYEVIFEDGTTIWFSLADIRKSGGFIDPKPGPPIHYTFHSGNPENTKPNADYQIHRPKKAKRSYQRSPSCTSWAFAGYEAITKKGTCMQEFSLCRKGPFQELRCR